MTKLEQAARQVLEALESAPVQYDFNSYPMLVMTPDTLQTTLTALREALKEQAEQEPVNACEPEHLSCPVCGYYCLGNGGIGCIDKPTLCGLKETPVQQAEQEPVGVVEGSGEWGIAGVLVAGVPIGTKLYAAPVRTVDLTDDEIDKLHSLDKFWDAHADDIFRYMDFARAVIAKFKEKNQWNS